MARQPLKSLTESMFYVLLALWRQERCGTEIAVYVRQLTAGRMRVYRITDAGRALFRQELENMRRCVDDGQREMGEEEET